MKIPLVADLSKSISRDYGVLKEDEGIAYRSVKPVGRCLMTGSDLLTLFWGLSGVCL